MIYCGVNLASVENALAGVLLSAVHGESVIVLDLHPSTDVSATVGSASWEPLSGILVALSVHAHVVVAVSSGLTWSPLLWFTSSVTASS